MAEVKEKGAPTRDYRRPQRDPGKYRHTQQEGPRPLVQSLFYQARRLAL